MEFHGADLGSLSTLLKESEEKRVQKEGESLAPVATEGSTQIVRGANAAVGGKEKALLAAKRKAIEDEGLKKTNIWNEKEIPNEDALIDESDDRKNARYEFSYKQSIGTQDTFLGLGDMTPGSSDCSHIIVKIHFPKSTMKDLNLDVTKNRIKASSKTHKLFTYLPVSVKKDEGKATFDTKKSVLSIELPIIHEFE